MNFSTELVSTPANVSNPLIPIMLTTPMISLCTISVDLSQALFWFLEHNFDCQLALALFSLKVLISMLISMSQTLSLNLFSVPYCIN